MRKAGITVCSGGIIGMGESIDDRCEMLRTLANLEPQPESVPINALVPVEGTPLANMPPVDPLDLVRMIAVARILMPKARVRLSAGRTSLSREAQLLCMLAGANSIFYGDKLLTTPNPDEDDDLALIRDAGLQPMPPRTEREHRARRTLRRLDAPEPGETGAGSQSCGPLALVEANDDDGDVVLAAGSVGFVDELRRGHRGVGLRREQRRDLLVGLHRREAVAAEQVGVALLAEATRTSTFTWRRTPERAPQVGRHRPFMSDLVVHREELAPTPAQPIGAAIANVCNVHAAGCFVVDRSDDSRAHSFELRRVLTGLVDDAIGVLDGPDESVGMRGALSASTAIEVR